MSKKNISTVNQTKNLQKLNTNDLKKLKGGSNDKADIIITDGNIL